MHKTVFTSGLLGGVVMLVWTAVWFGLNPYFHDVTAGEIPDEDVVFSTIAERLEETGIYSYPYDVPADSAFHAQFEAGPILQILFQSEGGAAPSETISYLGVVLAYLLVPIIPAWILSWLAQERRARFRQRVGVTMLFGIFVAIFRDISPTGLLLPINFSLVMAVHSLVGWWLVGLVLAWRMGTGKRMVVGTGQAATQAA